MTGLKLCIYTLEWHLHRVGKGRTGLCTAGQGTERQHYNIVIGGGLEPLWKLEDVAVTEIQEIAVMLLVLRNYGNTSCQKAVSHYWLQYQQESLSTGM